MKEDISKTLAGSLHLAFIDDDLALAIISLVAQVVALGTDVLVRLCLPWITISRLSHAMYGGL